jgi:hypothetical protein
MSALCWCILALLSSNGRNRGMFRHIQLKVTGLEGISSCKMNSIFIPNLWDIKVQSKVGTE